jgi:hypothetical protein
MSITTTTTTSLDVTIYLNPAPNGEINPQVAALAAIYGGLATVAAEECVITSMRPRLDGVIAAIHQLAASRTADPIRFGMAQQEIARHLMPLQAQVSAKHRKVARLLSQQSGEGAVDQAVEYDELHYRAWHGFIGGLCNALDAGRDASIEGDETKARALIVRAAGNIGSALHHYYTIAYQG